MTEQPTEPRTNPPARFLRLPDVQDRTGPVAEHDLCAPDCG